MVKIDIKLNFLNINYSDFEICLVKNYNVLKNVLLFSFNFFKLDNNKFFYLIHMWKSIYFNFNENL